MNRCEPEKLDTKAYGQMLKRILILEDGRVPARNAEDGKSKDKKKGYQEGMQKIAGGIRCWRLHGPTRIMEYRQEEKVGRQRSFTKEDGNQLREKSATHEQNFLSSWLREDVEGKKAEMERLKAEAKQEESKSGEKRGGGRRGKI